MSKESHLERTAAEPRQRALHETTIAEIQEINPSIRIIRLAIQGSGIKFLPGQWLDLYISSIPKPGGFTITSPPSAALPPSPAPYIELAIQRSPENPPAAWLWQPISELLSAPLSVRVGGSFVWPPPDINFSSIRRAVFIAGGVGINPLMSMLSSLAESPPAQPFSAHFLYSMRDPGPPREAKSMLFLEHVAEIFSHGQLRGELRLFLTTNGKHVVDETKQEVVSCDGFDVPFERRRISLDDLTLALGPEKNDAVVFVCGLPAMTDGFVERLVAKEGLGISPHRVFYEKWW